MRVDFSDIGHVTLRVEPYQAAVGCEVAPPNPNGELAESTNSVLSHELSETITDPDPPTGWVANSSLGEQGFEIRRLVPTYRQPELPVSDSHVPPQRQENTSCSWSIRISFMPAPTFLSMSAHRRLQEVSRER